MNYYEDDDRKGRMWGIISVVLYLGLCVGLMFVTYRITLPESSLGILVDFGTTDTGSGDADLPNSPVDARPVSPQPQNLPTDPVMTTEDPDAPPVVEEPRPVSQPARPAEETAPQREVNPRALFPGNTDGSTSTSQGSGEEPGNQGSQDGSPGGSDSAGGTGISGYSLDNRYMLTPEQKPAYIGNEQGRVVIQITVDGDGKVIRASFQQKNSTTNHGDLVNAAIKAAYRTRFTPDKDKDIQSGTITYTFRLN